MLPCQHGSAQIRQVDLGKVAARGPLTCRLMMKLGIGVQSHAELTVSISRSTWEGVVARIAVVPIHLEPFTDRLDVACAQAGPDPARTETCDVLIELLARKTWNGA
jgi:hypothetical protein